MLKKAPNTNPNENVTSDKGTPSIHPPTHPTNQPTTHIPNFINHEKVLGNPKCSTHWSCEHMIARSSTPKKYPFLLSFLNPKWNNSPFWSCEQMISQEVPIIPP